MRKTKWSWVGRLKRLKDDRWASSVTTWRPYDKKRRRQDKPNVGETTWTNNGTTRSGRGQRSSSVVSFTQCSPTCGRMPLPALSLWPGRQPYMPRLVGGRRGGGPSSVAPRSPPTGRRRDSPISSSLFSHGPPLCAVG